jgi:CMP-N-acetylneuraminic acid synthetase
MVIRLLLYRQDGKTIYAHNEALYLIRSGKPLEPLKFFPNKIQGIIIDQIFSIDIDGSSDWKMTEAIVTKK